MSRKFIIAGALAIAAIGAAAGSAQAQMISPYQSGYLLAMKRGYAPGQAECFASVFARRATVSPGATNWIASADHSYTDELWRRCRISR